MQPLKPEEKRVILENNPQAAPEDIVEYERLLSDRFTEDPDVGPVPAPAAQAKQAAAASREQRLKELYQKLFGRPGGSVPGAPNEP